MMNPLHYTLVLILLLLTYYHGGFCLKSDSSTSASDLADETTETIKATTDEIHQMEHSKDKIQPKNSVVKQTKPVPKKVPENAEFVQDEGEASTSVKQEIKQPEAILVETKAPVKSDQPLNPEKHVQDTMTDHGQGAKPSVGESEIKEVVPPGSCSGNQADGVLCDDVKKVISPELPKLSSELEKVPPEIVKVQEEGMKAPPEVAEEQTKTGSITEPEPVKQNEAAQEENKKEEAPKPAEGEAPKAAEVDEEKKAPVAGENATEPVAEGDGAKKVEGEVPTEKKEGTPSDAETVTPPINTIVQHEEEDMPSFNEWKKQQHEAKKVEEKEKSKQNGHTTQPGSTGSQLTRPSTMRTNYASLSCGAKVLSHNPEVQHASYSLNDNKDEYMINPCSANKWFIVELCEPVQVKFVEVANYELFSSLPKDVRLHTSDKYPSKDWKLLDTYTASEERKIHIFPVVGQQLYSKYLKVEVLSHFGTEHYCPLTLLRVFGTSYAEIDDDDDHDDVHTDEHVQADGASNIFTSATDIVMNVVKKVLNGGDDQQKPLDASSNGPGESENKSIPCSGRPFRPGNKDDTNATEDYDLPCIQGRAEPTKDQIKPDVPIPDSGVLQGSNVILDTIIRPSVPYPTIPQPVADETSRTASVVNVVNYYGATVLGAMFNLFKNCHVCETGQSKYRSFARLIGHGPCIYYCILTKCWERYGYCCKNCYKKSDLKTNPIPAVEQIDLYSTAVISSVEATMQPSAAPSTTADGVAEYETPTANTPAVGVTSTSVHIPLTTPEPVQEGTMIHPTGTLKSVDDAIGSVQSSVVTTILSYQSTQSVTLSSDVRQEHTSSTESVQSSVTLTSSMSGTTMGPDVAQGSRSQDPVSTPAMIKPSAVVNTESIPPKEEDKVPLVPETKKVDPPVEVVQNGNDNVNSVIKEETQDTDASNGDQFVMVDLPVAGAASAGKRESAIMRLNNRVKALELNMSLSSRYLEELSQRYKKQMEAMYRSFNITIGRLMNTSKWAEQSDQRQKEKTIKLHARIDELTQLVDALTKDLDKMNVKHLENHLVFLVLETMVMFILFLMCSRKNKQRTTQAELQELLANMSDHPRLLQRHNSDPAINTPRKPAKTKTRSLSDVDTKHIGSEGNLLIIEPSNFPFLNENKDLSKRRKRKKAKKILRVQSSDQLQELHRSASNTRTMESAGLLFSGNNGQNMKADSIDGVRIRTLSRSSSLNHIDVIFENSSSSCTASSQSTEGFNFENMTSNEVARKGSKKHSPRTGLDYGAIAKNSRAQQEFQLRELPMKSSPPFQKRHGRKFVEDLGARYNGHGPSRRFPNVPLDERSTNSDPAQYLRMRRQFVDNAESYSDGGQKRQNFRKKYDFDTFSDNGNFQNLGYVDSGPDLAIKAKKKFNSGGKKKPVDSRQFLDGQPQPSGQGRGRGRGVYRGRARQEMDGLGGFKTWVSYRH